MLCHVTHSEPERVVHIAFVEIRHYALVLKSCLNTTQYFQSMNGHIKTISRILFRDNTDIVQHINNISSNSLSFFQILALCRVLDFALPQRVSSKDIEAAFEKAFWKLEPDLSEDNRELAASEF